MPVTVTPAEFTFVEFDAAAIAATVEELLERLGLAGRALLVEVDETSPIARVEVESGEPIVLWAESGAFEDPRNPRSLSTAAVATACGRMLLRWRDRRGDGFEEAPADADLTLPQVAAWDAWSIGRLGRLGYDVNRQRWLYSFRNRHGFTDTADTVFAELWSAESLTWASLASHSDAALAARLPAPPGV